MGRAQIIVTTTFTVFLSNILGNGQRIDVDLINRQLVFAVDSDD